MQYASTAVYYDIPTDYGAMIWETETLSTRALMVTTKLLRRLLSESEIKLTKVHSDVKMQRMVVAGKRA